MLISPAGSGTSPGLATTRCAIKPTTNTINTNRREPTIMSDEEDQFRVGGRHAGKRGWQGSSMEMEHQQDSSRNKKRKNVAAMDVKQFYNTEVGEGYQARHVVRQPSKRDNETKVVDMTGGKDFKSEKRRPETKRFEKLIECKGLRDFRKEIEKILNSAK